MASNFTVQDLVNFVQPILKNVPLGVINGQQPGLGFAQIILNVILGPPFVWRTNRGNFSIPITQGGGTDYQIAIADLRSIETQWLIDGGGKAHQLTGAVSIPKTGQMRQPTKVAAVYDDNAGNVTFRFDAVPNGPYTAYFDYQKKAPSLTGWGMGFGPVSDEYAHLLLTGFLAWAALMNNDARFPIWEKRFIADLLGAQDGLDEQAKVIFMGNWQDFVKTAIRSTGAVQAGVAGRSQ